MLAWGCRSSFMITSQRKYYLYWVTVFKVLESNYHFFAIIMRNISL